MKDSRKKEILTFFADRNIYAGLKLQDKDFKEEELSELNDAKYIKCIDHNPSSFIIRVKGYRYLRGVVK